MKAVRDDGPDATLIQYSGVWGDSNWEPPGEWAANSALHDPQIKLVTKTAREQCKHEAPTELRKNHFKCEECGYEYRMIRQSVIKRGLYLRSARSLHRGK